MPPRRAGADTALQTQPKLSRFTLRGLLTLPYRLCNPPPAVGKVRSFGLTPIFEVRLADVLDRKHLPPLGLKDFEEWLLFVEQCPENLYFVLWLREYTAKYNAWAAGVRTREEKERARDARRARTASNPAKRRPKRRPERMSDVQEEEEEIADELDAEVEHARKRTYRVTWTARDAHSPSLALFFSRARETFFSPASPYELIVPPDLLSPFFVGSAAAPHDFASSSSSSSSSSAASSPISPSRHSPPAYLHPHAAHPHTHSPSPTHTTFPYPLPHPDPAVFAPLQAHIEARLQLSLQRFVRAAYTNVGTFRATCGIAAGCVALAAGCVPPLALAFAEADTRSRWARLFAMPAMWLGLTLILASLRGVCLMVYVFGDFRQLRRFELERPPPPPLPSLSVAQRAGEKQSAGLLQVPPPAAMGDGAGRLSAFVLPTSMSATLSPTTTSTLTSTTSSSSSAPYTPTATIALPAPIQVRALTAPPKISIRIPPARGHLLPRAPQNPNVHGRGGGSVLSVPSSGSGSGLGTDTSTSGETTLNSHAPSQNMGHEHTISISSERKSGLCSVLACSDVSSDEEGVQKRGRSRTRVHRVLDSDLDDDDDDEEDEEDDDDDDNGIYISPLMPPPEEAAENDPAVFSAALALVAQAKAKAARLPAGGEDGGEVGGETPQQHASDDPSPGTEKGASSERERERGMSVPMGPSTSAPALSSSCASSPNPNPNPTASFIPAFPYSAYQGTEEVDPWPVSACTSSEGGARSVSGSCSDDGVGAGAGARKRPRSAKGGERAQASPVTDRGPCWSVKKTRTRSRSQSLAGSRPGTGASGASLCGRLSKGRGGSGDVEKARAGDASDSAEDDDDDDAGLASKSGDDKAARRLELDIPKLPMGPFDFDALPPVTRPPPQHLLHHLSHSHAHAHAHAHAHRARGHTPIQNQSQNTSDLEKGYGAGAGAGAGAPPAHAYTFACGQPPPARCTAMGRVKAALLWPAFALRRRRGNLDDGEDGAWRAASPVGSVQTPSTLSALFALVPLPALLRRGRAPPPLPAATHAFADPYTQQSFPPPASQPTAAAAAAQQPNTSHPYSYSYAYTYTCPASPASTFGYGDAAGASKGGWRRAYAHVQRTPAFGPVTRVLSPVVSRAQWEIVVRAFVLAGLLTCVIEAALVALPGRW